MSRVLVVTSTFPQFPGDPRGAFLLTHWEARAAAGDQVRVLAPRTAWTRGAVGERVDVRRFPYAPARLSSLTGRHGILENIRERPWRALAVPALLAAGHRALSRQVTEFRPDRLVAHMMVPFGVPVARLAAARGVPFEIYGHGTDVDLCLAAPAPVRRALAALLARAQAVHVPSQEKASRLRAAMGDDLPLHVEPMVHCVPRPATTNSDVGRNVLYLGRLIRQKGVDVLLRAVAALPCPPLVDIAGDGPERRRLQRLAARLGVPARFHGFVYGPAKETLWRRAAVLCVPSRRVAGGLGEGAPLVVCEAQAHRVPVVASHVGGIPELCDRHPDARLVVPGDPVALAAALAAVLHPSRARHTA